MPESDSGQENHAGDPPASRLRHPGWKLVAGTNGGHYLVLKPSHPDYPSAIRERVAAQDAEEFVSDPRIRAAIDRLATNFSSANMVIENAAIQLLSIDKAVRLFSAKLIEAVEAEAEKLGPTKASRRLIVFLLRQTHRRLSLSPEFAQRLDENLSTYDGPFLVAVNISDRSERPRLYPGETAIHFDRLASRDLPRLSRIVTEAQLLAGQTDHAGERGRPKLPSIADEAATPETVAKLRHWEGWSYRRIAAFFGWVGPDEDWRKERVRRRVEQKVRRWVREGEAILRAQAGPDRDWRERPDHVERAVAEERPRI